MKLKVIDLFCGCGGLSLGLEQAGFQIVLGIDNCKDALQSFQKNHNGAQAYLADLATLQFSDLPVREADLIIGGPPCQGFSISGKRDPNDPRNQLYIAFVNAVAYYKPKAFIMENVPNLASMSGGRIKDTIVAEFEELGYSTSYKIMLASDYGVPQNRRRFVLVGLLNNHEFKFPSPTHSENKKVTTYEAISDLPEDDLEDGASYTNPPLSDYQRKMRVNSQGVYNHQVTNHTEKTKAIIALVPDGGNYQDLPIEYQNTRRVNIAWTRFSSQKPSLTIDTGHRHHFHYTFNRVPTVRESARLQSFPDSFIFEGSKTSQHRQVGNAVPPLLGKVLGESLLKQMPTDVLESMDKQHQ